jgi:hypothetical protein
MREQGNWKVYTGAILYVSSGADFSRLVPATKNPPCSVLGPTPDHLLIHNITSGVSQREVVP